MENRSYNPGDFRNFGDNNRGGRIFFGIAVALIGVAFLLKSIGMLPFGLHFTWPLILIIIGSLLAVKNGFRNNAWWILILIGVAHMIPAFEINGHSSRHLFWPAAVIIAGLMIAFRPRRKTCYPKPVTDVHMTTDSRLYVDVAFGGRKEIITAKDFKGGSVSVAFGGSEINLAKADFVEESIMLDCKVSFGGVELVIPSNWEVQNEIRPSFGSVEDSRVIHTNTQGEARKILILRGSCSFGSIEIKSY